MHGRGQAVEQEQTIFSMMQCQDQIQLGQHLNAKCEAESHLFSLNHRGCAYWALHCTTKHKSVFQPRHLGSEV